MTTRTTSEPSAASPLLDLQSLVVAVRRRRRLWSLLALVGFVLGAAVAVLKPPPPTAVATVLVQHTADQPNDPGTLIKTDAALLQTTNIAGAALKTLGSPDRPEDFIKDYSGTGLTNNLLQITVTARSETQATARAKALAETFVADHVARLQQAAEAESKALLEQRDRLKEELAQVNKSIGDASQGNASKTSPNLESLYASRAELTSRITDFGQRAAEARVGTPRLVAGTQIVDAPRLVKASLPKAAATDAAVGLVLGLVMGIALAAVGAVVADRPVLRREIAANLGASVLTELPRTPRGPLARLRRRRVREARERLTATLARRVRGGEGTVCLLELGSARSTAGIALDLAADLRKEGPVLLVDGLPGTQLARAPKASGTTVVRAAQAPDTPETGQLRLAVGSVAPGTAWTDLQYLGTRAVLVVRAGHGSTAWLHTVARQLAEQRIEVIGVVLIDPDPRDRTDGTLWDGPPAPPRGDGQPPARLNGTAPRRTERQPVRTAAVPDDDSDQEAR
ncbi:Wzz/FepE/Etk N-terminal domain-containing protein [Streptomyces sp. NRRL WC-3742]|uniref:Wzz/FepE/Etk N-terminal domain-containing protein n=1 Tax=Streptomyces sp. NRRL WC-3742 TaxID=1463934 RepID=UPI0004CC31C1|nr:Wzz/FepE/Etk N-terminal domain-containing protein [Streptomyces sp. NRRL WC-3742]